MIRRPPRSTRTTHSFPTRRSSDLVGGQPAAFDDALEHGLAIRGSPVSLPKPGGDRLGVDGVGQTGERSEEHTSELQSLMRISYAVFCLKKKKQTQTDTQNTIKQQISIRQTNKPHT